MGKLTSLHWYKRNSFLFTKECFHIQSLNASFYDNFSNVYSKNFGREKGFDENVCRYLRSFCCDGFEPRKKSNNNLHLPVHNLNDLCTRKILMKYVKYNSELMNC